MIAKGTATLADVAREAGVSVSTASRTLNGRTGRVSEETRGRIRSVAARLGYATNLAAQTMAVGRSRTVGLTVGDIPVDYQNPVMTGYFHAAASRGMLVTTAIASIGDVAAMRQAIRQLRGQRPALVTVAASVSADSPGMEELIQELQHVEDDGGRVVLIGLRGTPFDAVLVDDEQAGRSMAQALVAQGYRDFAVLAGSPTWQLSRDRTAGFVAGLAEEGIELGPDRIIYHESGHDGGYRGVGEALGRSPRPRAIFCINDAMAIGACVRLREQGLKVGDDVALAGCDDIPALRDIDPPLSTIRLPWAEAAERAFELAQHDKSDARTVVLEGYPVLRASTPPLTLT